MQARSVSVFINLSGIISQLSALFARAGTLLPERLEREFLPGQLAERYMGHPQCFVLLARAFCRECSGAAGLRRALPLARDLAWRCPRRRPAAPLHSLRLT